MTGPTWKIRWAGNIIFCRARMLTARDKLHERTVRLPDYESRAELDGIRESARQGELVCPACGQPLWLRAGEIRIPHFGHRTLSDCPQSRVSEAVLSARLAVYRFFQSRIESSKLRGDIELELEVEGLESDLCFDLLLRRPQRPWVAVFIIDGRVSPEKRWAIHSFLQRKQWLLRPVFLDSRLKRSSDTSDELLLDTTLRDFRLASAYDLSSLGFGGQGTLHFVNPGEALWTTARGLVLIHEPQVFLPAAVKVSSMHGLLWSEVYGEWVHPGEAEALKAFVEEKRRRQHEAALRAAAEKEKRLYDPELAHSPCIWSSPGPTSRSSAQDQTARIGEQELEGRISDTLNDEPEPPAWISGGLLCIGCGQRTKLWLNASPGQDACVCRACFEKGVRLPSR